MAKNQAFRGIKLLYIFLTVTPTDSACFAWGVDLTKRGYLGRRLLLTPDYSHEINGTNKL